MYRRIQSIRVIIIEVVYEARVHLFLSTVIPGHNSPGLNINVFLRPFIDELKQL